MLPAKAGFPLFDCEPAKPAVAEPATDAARPATLPTTPLTPDRPPDQAGVNETAVNTAAKATEDLENNVASCGS